MKKGYIIITAFLVLAVLPFALNEIMKLNSIRDFVGNDTDWLSFWGGYLGSIVTAGIALFVLWKQLRQNHKENNDNRNLQLRIFKHSNAQRELDEIRKRLIDFQASFNLLCINPIADNIINGNYLREDSEKLALLVRDIDEKEMWISVELNRIEAELKEFIKVKNEIYNEYGLLIQDFSAFIDLMRHMPEEETLIEPYVQYHIDIIKKETQEGISRLISNGVDVSPSIAFIIEELGDYSNIKKSVKKIMALRFLEPGNKIASLKEKLKEVILRVIDVEQKRIDSILTEESMTEYTNATGHS